MKVPFSWLKEYVDIDCTADELVAKLFSCGFEVEEVIKFGEKIDRIVSCKIVKIERHPNADKLSVCQVDAGEYGNLQIITAATNVFEGAIVPVALDGSTLYSGDKIKKGNLRGLPSFGMFCSGEELGITDDWYEGASVHGILIIKEDVELGKDIKEILQLNDVMFDINVTANRPDCQSILGIAREVAALLNKPLKNPDFSYSTDKTISTVNSVKIINNDFDLCQRYKGHLVKDIKIEPSPLWLKRRLFLMGLRSINNIVDITNYVLLEIGQPMHAFDVKDLSDSTIIVRRANGGEKITTLDDKEFILNESNLVICDAVKPVAIAGVMGGLNSEIKSDTKTVLFESAKFSRDNVRKTARTLGQRTDASARYEKGVDYLSVENGMNRALHLIDELKCGTIACDEYDLIDAPIKEKVIETTFTKVNGVLGIDVPRDTIINILERLNFKVDACEDNLKVVVPLYREDMDSYPDIVEEVIREYGYDNIVPTLLKTSSITSGGRNDAQQTTENLKNLLVGYGYSEMITYSFVAEKEFDLFGLDKSAKIRLKNPISEDLAVMRTSLFPSAVRTAANNLKRKNERGRLFELAKTYENKNISSIGLPTETDHLAFIAFGENEDFFTVKGVVEGVLETFCREQEVKYVRSTERFMHPTRSADIYLCGEKIGFVGQVNSEILSAYDVEKPIYGGEINYGLLTKFFNGKIIAKPVSKFPTVERDLAVIVDENCLYEEVINCIKFSGGKYLERVMLFDVYQGGQIESGKKSMAFNLVFVSLERTLSVEEVDGAIKKILKNLKEKLNAELR
ncbi:MAG: phenylalanine--tRNA ligase subunit beta [Clostridia bacterium]|nr:phenylalanine--tRNA ligase subunit beta [Clostridia bacterium]